MEGNQKKADDNEMYEATAGWDSYVTGLVAEKRAAADDQPAHEGGEAAQLERRRKSRDRTPSRRRSLLLSGDSDEQTARDS